MIRDLAFVMPDDIEIALPTKSAGQFFIRLEGGISTRLYLKMLRYMQEDKHASNIDAIEAVKAMALTIVREDKRYKDMTAADLEARVSGFPVYKALITSMYRQLPEIVNQPALKMPDLPLKGSSTAGGTAEIEDHDIMSDIAFVATHTAHTYQDIMDMPYITFAALLKSLVLSEALKNPEYREAFEKQQKYEALKSGRVKHRTKLDYEGLMRFGASL